MQAFSYDKRGEIFCVELSFLSLQSVPQRFLQGPFLRYLVSYTEMTDGAKRKRVTTNDTSITLDLSTEKSYLVMVTAENAEGLNITAGLMSIIIPSQATGT